MSTTPTQPSEPTPVAAPRNAVLNNTEQATIGKSLVIKGEVTGSESLYIDGRVEGSVNLPGNRVTVGRNGQVQANINAKEVVVLGKVKGNVTASDRVDIRNEGSLGGDVVCQRITIEDGAWFKGSIDIRKPGAKEMNGTSEGSHFNHRFAAHDNGHCIIFLGKAVPFARFRVLPAGSTREWVR